MTSRIQALGVFHVFVCCIGPACAQIDPAKRELIQLGYNQPFEGHGPISAYAFYYLNLPHFYRTNLTLRFALAPLYLDSELGIREAIGPHTDLGIGLSGGGFADGYSEVRGGKYLKSESFSGHGVGLSANVYHLFNPGQSIPLNGILRMETRYAGYLEDSDTDDNFELPHDKGSLNLRSGLRFGGREPLMLPEVAMELSVWQESQFRANSGSYGFNDDRRIQISSHLFWARALLTYTLPKLRHDFSLNLTGGASVEPDRFSSYRLGGVLPFAAEFPLTLPGYYFQEISAKRFVLFGGQYFLPLDSDNRWAFTAVAATATVQYVDGLEQPGHWHSGVGGGIRYRSPKDAWQVVLAYAYGIDAIRDHGRGAHNIGLLIQFDLERARVPLFDPGEQPIRSRVLQRIFQGISF
ncbi:MAG: hypothetical protein L0Y58_05820 [Verrucomicrobia subdivision 3 bacterium]|nr:hypothetical protein [Limisphaerales bacterium]